MGDRQLSANPSSSGSENMSSVFNFSPAWILPCVRQDANAVEELWRRFHLPAVLLHFRPEPALQSGTEGNRQVGELDAVLPVLVVPGDAAHHFCFLIGAGNGETESNRHSKPEHFLGPDSRSIQAEIQQDALELLIEAFHLHRNF